MSKQSQRQGLFCEINRSIGQQPSLGPIPAALIAPSGGILFCLYFLLMVVLKVGIPIFLLVTFWCVATWWVVVGEKVWKYINKFVPVPNWKRGFLRYQPLLFLER